MTDDRAALDELAARLWDERRIVTFLLYRLTVSRLLLAADERRFITQARREVDQTVGLLLRGELRRNEAVRALAERWQVAPDEVSLPVVAAQAPPPFDHTFTEHLAAFRELAAELAAVPREDRSLTRVGLDHLADSIEQLTGLEPASEADTAAVGNRVASANVRAEDSLPPRRREVADAQGVDGQDGDGTPETMELQIQEIGYRATLQALPKALPPSLASFLR
jgi:hypothetical protein